MRFEEAIKMIQVAERARQGRRRALFMKQIHLEEKRKRHTKLQEQTGPDPDDAATCIQKVRPLMWQELWWEQGTICFIQKNSSREGNAAHRVGSTLNGLLSGRLARWNTSFKALKKNNPRGEINGHSPAPAAQDDSITYMLFFCSGFYDLNCSFWHHLEIQCLFLWSLGREFISYLEKKWDWDITAKFQRNSLCVSYWE